MLRMNSVLNVPPRKPRTPEVTCSELLFGGNPRPMFNWAHFFCFYNSAIHKTSGNKTTINPDKIYEEIFPSL